MADFVARNLPEGLLERSKAAAALKGLDLREWLIEAAREKLEKMVVDGVDRLVREAPVKEKEEPVVVMGKCRVCEKDLVLWGDNWLHCVGCGRNWPKDES